MKRLKTKERSGGRTVLSLRDETRTERGVRGWNCSLWLCKEKRGRKVQYVCVKTLDSSGRKRNAQMRCSLLSVRPKSARESSASAWVYSVCVCLRQWKREQWYESWGQRADDVKQNRWSKSMKWCRNDGNEYAYTRCICLSVSNLFRSTASKLESELSVALMIVTIDLWMSFCNV